MALKPYLQKIDLEAALFRNPDGSFTLQLKGDGGIISELEAALKTYFEFDDGGKEQHQAVLYFNTGVAPK